MCKLAYTKMCMCAARAGDCCGAARPDLSGSAQPQRAAPTMSARAARGAALEAATRAAEDSPSATDLNDSEGRGGCAGERRDSVLPLRLVALATPRSLCSSPQPSPAPRACPAPASCGQGPKRPPRPASGLPAGCLPPQRSVLLELCLAASGRPHLLARCGCNSRSDQSTVYGW